jgi:hypothetical protein
MQTVPGPAAPSRKQKHDPERSRSQQPIRPPGVPKGINPQTGMPLRRGQRLPTYGERDEAIEHNAGEAQRLRLLAILAGTPRGEEDEALLPYPRGSFPLGAQYELIPELCRRWLSSEYLTRLLERFESYGGDPTAGEWPQFAADLLCYQDLSRRGLLDPERYGSDPERGVELHEYLAATWEMAPGPDGPERVKRKGEGREHWGMVARALDDWCPGWRERVRRPGMRAAKRERDAEA